MLAARTGHIIAYTRKLISRDRLVTEHLVVETGMGVLFFVYRLVKHCRWYIMIILF